MCAAFRGALLQSMAMVQDGCKRVGKASSHVLYMYTSKFAEIHGSLPLRPRTHQRSWRVVVHILTLSYLENSRRGSRPRRAHMLQAVEAWQCPMIRPERCGPWHASLKFET